MQQYPSLEQRTTDPNHETSPFNNAIYITIPSPKSHRYYLAFHETLVSRPCPQTTHLPP